MQAIILAAGKGTRLQPLTLTRTKAMVPVVGKPLVQRVLETILPSGVREVILVVSPDDMAIRAHFAQPARLGVPVRFVEQPERLGMAKALALAAPYIDGPFVLSACDNLTTAAHIAGLVGAQRWRRAAATLSLMPVEPAQVSKTGVVVWDGQAVQRIVEKPRPEEAPSTISSLPLYVFSPDILDDLPHVQPSPRGEYELQDAIQRLIDRGGRVTGVLLDRREQVTNAADLLALNLHFLDAMPEPCAVEPGAQLAADVTLHPPVRIDAGAQVGRGARVGPGVYVEAGSRIGAEAQIRQALVLRGAVVADGAVIQGQVVS
ncbi:MAG: NTP transferase domain-containing protein [Caldilineaceae bacterium]|nr:NTP transferase domain-containing protein [Caldilineaceae bacterium]